MEKTFFFHIPKCAGISVWSALKEIYGPTEVFQIGEPDQRRQFREMTPERRAAYGAIGGHGILSQMIEDAGDLSGYFKFTTFRHPVDRVISEYYFIRRIKQHFKHDIVSGMSLLEFAQQNDVTNIQTRLLCDAPDPDKAIAVLDSFFDDYSLLDDLDDFVGRLYDRFGKKPKPARHKNGREDREGPEHPDVVAAIASLNQADLDFFTKLEERRNLNGRPNRTKSKSFWAAVASRSAHFRLAKKNFGRTMKDPQG